MKKVIFLCYSLLALLAFTGCDEPVNPKPAKETWSGTIPADLQSGVWFWGSAGPLSYYDPDGNEVGKEIEAGRQYKFFVKDGQDWMEFQQYLGLRNSSNCVTEIYTHQRGRIKFESNNKFTFYPEEGSFRTVKNGKSGACPKEDNTRLATADELKPRAGYYELKEFSGDKLFYEYTEEDETLESPVFVFQKADL